MTKKKHSRLRDTDTKHRSPLHYIILSLLLLTFLAGTESQAQIVPGPILPFLVAVPGALDSVDRKLIVTSKGLAYMTREDYVDNYRDCNKATFRDSCMYAKEYLANLIKYYSLSFEENPRIEADLLNFDRDIARLDDFLRSKNNRLEIRGRWAHFDGLPKNAEELLGLVESSDRYSLTAGRLLFAIRKICHIQDNKSLCDASFRRSFGLATSLDSPDSLLPSTKRDAYRTQAEREALEARTAREERSIEWSRAFGENARQ